MKSAAFLVMCVMAVATPSSAQQDILFAELYLPDSIDRWYNAVEMPRLDKLCGADSACVARSFERKQWMLTNVYSAPSRRGKFLGSLVAHAAFSPGEHLHIGIRYVSKAGLTEDWLSSVGDWGYGFDVFVAARRGRWLRLPPHPFPASAWIEVEDLRTGDDEQLRGETGSVVGTIVSVASGISAWHSLTRRFGELPAGINYVVERIRGSDIYLRAEVGADMPCGDAQPEKDVPTLKTPRYRVSFRDMFGKNGLPLLEPAYPRGC